MEAKDIQVDLAQLKKDRVKNFKERLKFIDWRVEYMKKQEDGVWSKQQNFLINSVINVKGRLRLLE